MIMVYREQSAIYAPFTLWSAAPGGMDPAKAGAGDLGEGFSHASHISKRILAPGRRD